jgi:hypothetical protein
MRRKHPKRRAPQRAVRYQVEFHYEPGQRGATLAPYADALVLLTSDTTLDEALALAHNINTAAHRFDAEQRVLEAQATELRTHLADLERRLRETRE